ncbi:ComEB Deoxycytidylate deaminase [uncultured Caudovirales phage]|uniref:ComEB Deoxycytidylate deaminase n=1 Tax=uncultured Caudovirales phage TaxID=2100421 RepID=A0A6J7WVP5_9CAUD|nr:ComEB Deoxycytidylate deaminase [uncultured Caudovirales phage]
MELATEATPPPGRLLTKWDFRFLQLAQNIAVWSKDPSTQVGAVIVRPDRTIASLGFNGFARGVDDSEERLAERNIKYLLTVHAEENAILSAHERLSGYWLYTSHHPCDRCASRIVQAGIGRVVCMTTKDYLSRWEESVRNSRVILGEAGIPIDVVELVESQTEEA